MHGLIMNSPLTLTSILRRARDLFADGEIATREPGGVHRYTYGDFYHRVLRLMGALKAAGVKPVYSVLVDPNKTDLTDELNKEKAAGASGETTIVILSPVGYRVLAASPTAVPSRRVRRAVPDSYRFNTTPLASVATAKVGMRAIPRGPLETQQWPSRVPL